MSVKQAIGQALLRMRADEDETGETAVKILSMLSSGYRLSEFVDDAMAEQDLVQDPAELLDDEVGARLLAIARVRIPDSERARKIAAAAAARLVTRFNDAYLAKVRKNSTISELRRAAHYVTEEVLEQLPDRKETYVSRREGRIHTPEPLTPLVVLERRLELIYATEDHAVHEMLAFGFNVHLQHKPEEIVCDLGQIPIPQLARVLMERYCQTVQGDLQEMFPALRRVAEGRSQEYLAQRWDPQLIVQEWIDTLRRRKQTGEDISTEERPHWRLAFLFANEFSYDAARLVATYGAYTLEDLAVEFVAGYSVKRGLSQKETARRFELALQLGKWSTTPLRTFFDPRRTVSDWLEQVQRRLRRAEMRETAAGLAKLISAYRVFPPYETLAFLFVQCLGESLAVFAKRAHGAPLKELREECEESFAARFAANAEDRKVLSQSFRALGQMLIASNDRTLSDFSGGIPVRDAIAMWRDRLFRAVPKPLADGKIAPLFAWRCNLLPDRLLYKAIGDGK